MQNHYVNQLVYQLFLADGPEMPSIRDFLPNVFLFQGSFVEVNRFEIVRFSSLAFILLFFGMTLLRAKKRADSGNNVPTKPQIVIEYIFEFVRNMAFEQLGEAKGRKWLPMITTIFCTVLFMNLTGIIPGLNLAATAGFGIPLLLGVWVFTAYWREGIASHGGSFKGFLKFLKAELFPPGLPIFVYPLITTIELLQLLVIRPISLAIRLFANMLAGHMLLALCYGATQFFIFVAEPAMKGLSAVTLFGAIFFTCLEIFVAALQAYVFSVLLCAYLSMSSSHEESHEESHA